MPQDLTRCAHCDVAIVERATAVVHGDQTFCCPNCAAAMEQAGSGSDPQALRQEGDLRCDHCGVPIVDESTMEARGNEAFCCPNCAAAVSKPVDVSARLESAHTHADHELGLDAPPRIV